MEDLENVICLCAVFAGSVHHNTGRASTELSLVIFLSQSQ